MKWKYEKLVVWGLLSIIGLATTEADARLVGLWEFDGTANDSCGDSHGSIVGNPSWETGGIGGALLLDGDDHVMIHGESKFDLTDAMTVAVWIEARTAPDGSQSIVSKGSWALRKMNNGNNFTCGGVEVRNDGGGNNRGVRGDVNIDDGQWHHVAGVYDGSKMYLYVDSVLDESADASGAMIDSRHNLCIGRSANPEKRTRNFVGMIGEVAVFDHALSESEIKQLYDQGGASFIPKTYMAGLVEEAESTVKRLDPQDAVTFLEDKIAQYRQWKAMNLRTIEPRDRQLSSDVYVLLARAKEAAGLPKQDVVAAYKQSISRVLYRSKYVPAALLWLSENVPADDYINLVQQFVCNTDDPVQNIRLVVRHLEPKEDWDAFKLFLDGTFSTVEFRESRTRLYAQAVVNSLKENGVWATKFEDYCRNKPELTTYLFRKHEEMAREYIAQQNFGKAAEIYRDIVGQCGPNQEKTIYEFNVCECLFNSGQYDSAIHEIDSFIKDNKATNKALVRRAILLKGQAYVHLGDIDQATDTFLTLMVEYPQAKEAPEANFFVGYCYMLQGKFKEATEAFNLVVQDYPESSYFGKAHSYLGRIKNMTE